MLLPSRFSRALAAAVLLTATAAGAQSYPAKPVRVLVGFPPGAGVDITTRLFTPKLAEALEYFAITDDGTATASSPSNNV